MTALRVWTMSKLNDFRPPFDKSNIEVRSFDEADREDRAFWLAKSPLERLRALEQIRLLAWGYGNGKPRPEFQRVVEVLERPWG